MAINIGENSKIQAMQAIALEQGRDYIRRALLQQNPSLTTIYSTIKPIVDNHTPLQTMVTNQIELMRAAFAWPVLNLTTPTAIDRARYVQAVLQVIALLG